jgi:cyclo(L-tyrosyl-L-tyrosyl) synthase
LDFQVEPLNEKSRCVYERREHICLGISPYNSLFSEEYISSLISWAQKNFEDFHLFLPDEPTIYTLMALGYDEAKARKKLKKQINWLSNKIFKAFEANHFTKEQAQFRILDWQTLSKNECFNEKLRLVYEWFDQSSHFRSSCLEASNWVLENKVAEDKITEASLLQAVKYFLAELPLFASCNEITQKKTSLFCYHQSIPFHDELYAQKMELKSSTGQGYARLSLLTL